MPLDGHSLSERAFEADLRLGKIVYLPLMGASDMDGDMLDWLIEQAETTLAEALGISVEDFNNKVVMQYGDRQDAQRESVAEAIMWKPLHGWLIEAESPVKQRKPGMTGAMFSWGYYHTKVIYGETFEEALDKAFAWAEEQEVEDVT